MLIFAAAFGGIIASVLGTSLALRSLRRLGVMDVPNFRSSHRTDTVRGGGIGLAFGTLVTMGIDRGWILGKGEIALFVAGICFGVIGFIDDLTRGTSIRTRIVMQLAASLLVIALVGKSGTYGIILSVTAFVIAAVWIISFVNAFNFMDGINGISSAEAIVSGFAIGAIARVEHHYSLEVAGIALAAGALGFLPYNFPRAHIFLGDVGSYFIGSWIATMVVIGLWTGIALEAMLGSVVLYVADTGVTLVRRLWKREPWRQAHRDHTYQRLVDQGWSHVQTTGIVFCIVALSSLLGSVSLFGSTSLRILADLGIAALTGGYLISPHLIDRFRRATS